MSLRKAVLVLRLPIGLATYNIAPVVQRSGIEDLPDNNNALDSDDKATIVVLTRSNERAPSTLLVSTPIRRARYSRIGDLSPSITRSPYTISTPRSTLYARTNALSLSIARSPYIPQLYALKERTLSSYLLRHLRAQQLQVQLRLLLILRLQSARPQKQVSRPAYAQAIIFKLAKEKRVVIVKVQVFRYAVQEVLRQVQQPLSPGSQRYKQGLFKDFFRL